MPKTIESEIDALHRMTTSELVARYAELHGHDSRTRHRGYLIRKIAWRMQALAEGDLSERAHKRAAELADDAEVTARLKKKWDKDIEAYDDVYEHILKMADALSEGIIKQFPDKF